MVSEIRTERKTQRSDLLSSSLCLELTLSLHRSQHGERLHVPSRDHRCPGSPPGPSTGQHQPSLLVLPAHACPGLPGSGGGAALLPQGPHEAARPRHVTPFCPQSVASQAPQSLPAISQPPQPGTMGYMGSPAVMGYQPYGVQVRTCETDTPTARAGDAGQARPFQSLTSPTRGSLW